MRVWVFPEKTWEEFGSKRWSVEWWTIGPKAKARVEAAEARGEQDEYDPDRDIVCNYRIYPERAKGRAIAYAKSKCKVPDSAYGCATVTLEAVDWYVEEDRVAEWTPIEDPIYVP